MHALFSTDRPPGRWGSRTAMYLRRFRTWLGQFHWWAILALLVGIFGVVIAFTDRGLTQVVAVGALSITLGILATREEPPL
jgi:membrane-bound ClpP family serine protease